MTQQIVHERGRVKTDGCERCKHREQTAPFDLCRCVESRYSVGESEDYHTIQHMRGEYGKCGPYRKLFVGAVKCVVRGLSGGTAYKATLPPVV